MRYHVEIIEQTIKNISIIIPFNLLLFLNLFTLALIFSMIAFSSFSIELCVTLGYSFCSNGLSSSTNSSKTCISELCKRKYNEYTITHLLLSDQLPTYLWLKMRAGQLSASLQRNCYLFVLQLHKPLLRCENEQIYKSKKVTINRM